MTEPFQFKDHDVKIEKRETVFHGFFRMDKLWLTPPAYYHTIPIVTKLFFSNNSASAL